MYIENILRHDVPLCPQRKHSSGVTLNVPTRYKAYAPLVPPEMQTLCFTAAFVFFPPFGGTFVLTKN